MFSSRLVATTVLASIWLVFGLIARISNSDVSINLQRLYRSKIRHQSRNQRRKLLKHIADDMDGIRAEIKNKTVKEATRMYKVIAYKILAEILGKEITFLAKQPVYMRTVRESIISAGIGVILYVIAESYLSDGCLSNAYGTDSSNAICRFNKVIEIVVLVELVTASVFVVVLVITVSVTVAINAPILHTPEKPGIQSRFVDDFRRHDGCLDMNTLIASTISEPSRESIVQNRNTVGYKLLIEALNKAEGVKSEDPMLTDARIKLTRDINYTVGRIDDNALISSATQIAILNMTAIVTVVSIPDYRNGSQSLIDSLVSGTMALLLAAAALGVYGVFITTLHIRAFYNLIYNIRKFHKRQYHNSTYWHEAMLCIQWWKLYNSRKHGEAKRSAWPDGGTSSVYNMYNSTAATVFNKMNILFTDSKAKAAVGKIKEDALETYNDEFFQLMAKLGSTGVCVTNDIRCMLKNMLMHEAIWRSLTVENIIRHRSITDAAEV